MSRAFLVPENMHNDQERGGSTNEWLQEGQTRGCIGGAGTRILLRKMRNHDGGIRIQINVPDQPADCLAR